LLTIPEITNDEAAEIERALEKKLQENSSKLVTYDRWGKFLLAYPVKSNEYGIYFLARFDIPVDKNNEVVKELKSLFNLKFNATIMRYLISNIPNDSPAVYKRPQSLDETPKDVDQFLKENKMSGFAPKRSFGGQESAPKEEVLEADKQEMPGE
jgi:ribosomal protein S6